MDGLSMDLLMIESDKRVGKGAKREYLARALE